MQGEGAWPHGHAVGDMVVPDELSEGLEMFVFSSV